MSSIPLCDREKEFRFLEAREAFKSVVRTSAFAINNRIDRAHELFHPLVLAAHVSYARPFLSNYGFGKLDEVLVPSEHRKTHERLMEFRNRVYAHSQLKLHVKGAATARVLDYHAVYLRIIDGMAYSTVAMVEPDADCFTDLYSIANVLIEKLRYHSLKWHRKYKKLMPKKDGTYRLNMVGTGETFERADDVDIDPASFAANLPTLHPSRS